MPRPMPASQGIRGPGQTIFPEDAKEAARRIGLVKDAVVIIKKEQVDDGGGDFTPKWVPQKPAVRGRIDPLGGASKTAREFAGAIDEATTHLVVMDPDVDIDNKDRLEAEGIVWTITADLVHTDAATTLVQVKELNP